jgi:four helix bundle protein
MRSHKDLEVWKAAVRLAKTVYDVTHAFPRREEFALASQMRRSSVSIASNIAEGAARQGDKEFVQYLYVSLGSASELDTQIEIAKLAELAPSDSLEKVASDLTSVSKMLQGLIRSVKAKSKRDIEH